MTTFSLRHVLDEDHEFLVELHNDPIVLMNITNPQPVTLEQHYRWWNSIKSNPKEERLLFTVNGEKVGFTKFYNIDVVNGNCVLGADIHKAFRGKGYAKHMWSLMLDRAFKQHELHRVSLTTAEYNHVALKVYQSLGFVHEGKQVASLKRHDTYYDQICMYMLKDAWLNH